MPVVPDLKKNAIYFKVENRACCRKATRCSAPFPTIVILILVAGGASLLTRPPLASGSMAEVRSMTSSKSIAAVFA